MTEDEELQALQALFTEDVEVSEKRREVLKTIKENDLSSFPTDLSVLSAFDDVLLCFAFGGQIKNYYRYGSYTTCEDARKKFWFAVVNGAMTESQINVEDVAANPRELERRQKVQEYYKECLLEKQTRGSSEDIWDARKTLLKSPFRE